MTTVISIFNNKGGVGKTTYVFHVAHILARQDNPTKKQRNVLLVDLDTQGNLTGYCLDDTELQAAWGIEGNSIYRVIQPIIRGTGDYEYKAPQIVKSTQSQFHLIPGDLRLSDFEDLLGDSWNSALGGAEASLRIQSALSRFIREAAKRVRADVVFIDLGPNLGALNRSALAISDYFITPMAPDLFSIQGTENLGNKLVIWAEQWKQIHNNWSGGGLELPSGEPSYLGYVMQMHNVRNNSTDGMTKGWAIFGQEIENAVSTNIVGKIGEKRSAQLNSGTYKLGNIPNLHSLIPYSQSARKPIFDCASADGLNGSHITSAKASIHLFDDIIGAIDNVLP
jgi:cellulose biosynthesis protein BcsQ